MKAYVAVTDNDWFRFLRDRAPLDEVNFWQPGGHRIFKALKLGEPFLFKLHQPENFIVGGGFFTWASLFPASRAWEFFGEKNGAASFDAMRHLIERHRHTLPDPHRDYAIGCIVLRDPFFFEEHNWIPVPDDFHANIVQGKTYDLTTSTGKNLWRSITDGLQGLLGSTYHHMEERPIYGQPVLVHQRLGQGAFRMMVTDKYQRRCAVTQEKVLPVLEAAHIRPVNDGGVHRIDNGLLLRSDVHVLFDRGYVTATPDYRFRVSRRLRDDFDNGEYYYQFEGAALWLPRRTEDRPGLEFLEWHADTVFRG